MLRVLDPNEQAHITLEAQALIYKYRGKGWLTAPQLEQLITETVIIAQLRHKPGDVNLVTSVLQHMDAPIGQVIEVDPSEDVPHEQPHLLS